MTAPLEPVAPAPSQEWIALGVEFEATAHNRKAAGRGAWDSAQFADFLRRLSQPYFDGAHELDTFQMAYWYSRCAREPTRSDLHEYECAVRWVTREARSFIADESIRSGGREVSFVLRPGPDGRFTDPRVCVRGNATETRVLGADVNDGDLVLHTHPARPTEPTGHLEPSGGDLEAMNKLLSCTPAAGFGIVSLDGDRLYLLRDPRPVAPAAGSEAAA